MEIKDSDEITFLTYEEMADMLGVSARTAREIVKGGGVPLVRMTQSNRVHRVRLADVKRFTNAGGFRADV